MFGFDAPTAMLVLLGGFALVATLSMRRMAGGDDDPEGRPARRMDPTSLLIGALVIGAAVVASLVVLGIWP
jgi:hypothetical protein